MGRFGRMFRNLPPFRPTEDQAALDHALESLATSMREPDQAPSPTDGWAPSREDLDSQIPAGYTYLGQFIDHDVTFDPVSSFQRQNDPDSLHNFRTPRFDLDSLYGAGPSNDPFMYDQGVDNGRTTLLVGDNAMGDSDLPRNRLPDSASGHPQGRALTGDPRNDENIIISQLHLVFLRFHNKVVQHVREEHPTLTGDALFEEAQRQVRWHYQWIVVHDFLPRIVGRPVVDNLLGSRTYVSTGGTHTIPEIKRLFYHWHEQPFMPVEFSVAAYRFGHSMIRPSYKINDTVPERPIFPAGPDPDPLEAFHGFRPLPQGWTIDWRFFFEGDEARLQMARKIDAKLASPTFALPGLEPGALALRNLVRARSLGLPSGQRVARAMGIPVLSPAELGIGDLAPEFRDEAPLWFYVLKESELGGGNQLGAVGGRIVAEVLLGLLDGDPLAYINLEPNWKPTLAGSETFTMVDLVAPVG